MERETFSDLVHDAYRHLYDMSYLRSHPLVDILTEPHLPAKERAWRLHRCLIEVIDELQPEFGAAPTAAAWRRHHLLVLRYQEGWAPQEIADELGISRRHFYREHDSALLALIDLLWQRRVNVQTEGDPHQPHADRLELLRRETAHIWQEHQNTALDQVLAGVTALFADIVQQNRIRTDVRPPGYLPPIAIESSLLRQLLIGAIGYVLHGRHDATLSIMTAIAPAHSAESGPKRADSVEISIQIDRPALSEITRGDNDADRLVVVRDLAALNRVDIKPICEDEDLMGVRLWLPCRRLQTVLVVDDNADTLHWFERLLVPNHYHVVTAQSAEEAVRRARQVLPDLILLDLMMPEQDGWDLLQIFRGEERTRKTPVIVCSILRQRELALAFGANGFLEKPIREADLLGSLASNMADT